MRLDAPVGKTFVEVASSVVTFSTAIDPLGGFAKQALAAIGAVLFRSGVGSTLPAPVTRRAFDEQDFATYVLSGCFSLNVRR